MKKLFGTCFISAFFLATSVTAAGIDWNKVDEQNFTFFYPGQASWEWLLTQHKGSKSLRKGAPCLECHETEEPQMGKTLVTGKKLESMVIAGKPGSVSVNIKAAIDKEYLYIQAQWHDPEFASGKKMDEKHETKFAIMFDNGKVKEAGVAGCWGVCHVDSSNMPSANNEERELYVSASRKKLTRNGGGDNYKKTDELNALLHEEKFMEFWQARIARDKTTAVSGYILEKRHAHKQEIVSASATKNQNMWTVEFKRKLKSKGDGIKTIDTTAPIQMGFAIHDDYTKSRFHYVSFGKTLSMNGDPADIKAQQF